MMDLSRSRMGGDRPEGQHAVEADRQVVLPPWCIARRAYPVTVYNLTVTCRPVCLYVCMYE